MKVLEARTCVEIDYAQEAENSLLRTRMTVPAMPAGAPYVEGDSIWVQAGSDRFYPAEVLDRSFRARAAFGLCWVLLVRVTPTVGCAPRIERVFCDDNGRNRTRTHQVMPA